MIAWRLPTRAATLRLGEALGKLLRPGQTVALVGDLGAGKTTLAQAIARGLGVTSYVSSPTYGLVHEYPGRTPLFHFDPYRLQRSLDLTDIGFDEYFQRGGVVLIEWADRVSELLPRERLTLSLDIIATPSTDFPSDDVPRTLVAEASGSMYVRLLADLAGDPALRDLIADGSTAAETEQS